VAKKRKSTTASQVARALRVSRTTVSLVLSGRAGHYRIGEATQARIQAKARELGYHPRRSQRRRKTLLVCLSNDLCSVDRPGFVNEILTPLIAELADRGWRTTLAPYANDNPLGVSRAQLGDATAVVLPADVETERLVEALAREALKAGIVPVTLGNTYPGLPALMVDGDQYQGGRVVAEHLLGLGHRDVAVVLGDRASEHSIKRCRGFSDFYAERGHPLPEAAIWGEGGFWVVRAHRLTLERVTAGARPSAIFYLSDAMAVGGVYALREAGLRVPGDVSVAGFDDSTGARELEPALTTVRVETGDAGIRLAQSLVQVVKRGRPEALHIRCPVRLIVRDSTRHVLEPGSTGS